MTARPTNPRPWPRLLPLLPLLLLCWLPAAAQNAATLLARAQQLEHGEGVPRDQTAAAALYCQAARLGAAEAQYALGWMYANGRGLARDDASAWRLFSLAAEQGYAPAQGMLRLLPAAPATPLPACMAPEPMLQIDLPDSEPDYVAASRLVRPLVDKLAPQYDIDPALAMAIIAVESGFNPHALSPRQAQGLMQLIPDTAQRFRVKNAFDAEANIRGGLAYLRWLLTRFQGDVRLVAAAYNAGEQAVASYGGVPPYRETQDYVRKVAALYRPPTHPYASPK
jgi:soluble lytic murein transglycosylase-like protein